MRNKTLIFLIVIALGLAGCSKEEDAAVTTVDVDQQPASTVIVPAIDSSNVDSSDANAPVSQPSNMQSTTASVPTTTVDNSQNQLPLPQAPQVPVSVQQEQGASDMLATQRTQVQEAAAKSPIVAVGGETTAPDSTSSTNPDVQMVPPSEAYPKDSSMQTPDPSMNQSATPKDGLQQLPQLPPLPPPLPQSVSGGVK